MIVAKEPQKTQTKNGAFFGETFKALRSECFFAAVGMGMLIFSACITNDMKFTPAVYFGIIGSLSVIIFGAIILRASAAIIDAIKERG